MKSISAPEPWLPTHKLAKAALPLPCTGEGTWNNVLHEESVLLLSILFTVFVLVIKTWMSSSNLREAFRVGKQYLDVELQVHLNKRLYLLLCFWLGFCSDSCHMLVGKNGYRDMSLPLHCRTRLSHGPGGVTGFTAARGKPASVHAANAFATLVIRTLFSAAFPPWLLVSAPVPPCRILAQWHVCPCGGFYLFFCQIPGPYSCCNHANSYANKKGRARAEW